MVKVGDFGDFGIIDGQGWILGVMLEFKIKLNFISFG